MLKAGDIISVNEDQVSLTGMAPGEYVLEEFTSHSLKAPTQDGNYAFTVSKSWAENGFVKKIGELVGYKPPNIKVGDKVEVVDYERTGIREGVYEVVNRVGSLIFLEGGRVMQDSWVEKGFIKKVGEDSSPSKQEKIDVDDEYVLWGEERMDDTLAIDEPVAIPTVFELIEDWAQERNLIEGSNPNAQFVKLIEEIGELANDIAKGKCVKDSIGDSVVVLTILAAQYDTNIEECAWEAYEEIRHRKGRIVNGVFIKEEDVNCQ